MTMKILIAFLSVLALGCRGTPRQQRMFPEDFHFGTATASYQIEGAWNEDGKGENIWDHMTHNQPDVIKDKSNGDVAADSYHNYRRDVEMMRELGIDVYRFSLSWSRILPNGFGNHINQAGIDFYNNYIDEMLKYNIQPMVTLYHWDLPQKLQDLGGFQNPLFTDWFEDFARVAYQHFGDRVKHWITFNEPNEICYQGYGSTTMAPRLNATGVGEYICAKNLVTAHAKAYHLYNNEFKAIQGGVCGITLSVSWQEPWTDSEEDEMAAELARQAHWAIYADPIFSEQGGFPKELIERVAEKSAQQGYSRSRLPTLTEEERDFVHGSFDFFGVNHYTGGYVSADKGSAVHAVPSMYDDIGGRQFSDETWPQAASSWLRLSPKSLYKTLTNISKRYNYPPIYVTENGWSTYPDDDLNDEGRITYYRAALEDVLDALDEGVDLKGYMAWSLMDNFEWMQGYTERFGLYHVDFEDPMRTRTPRKSAFVYKQIVRTRTIDHQYQPDTMVMTIDEGH